MTAISDNELLTRVGPGTLLGNFMREYWVPAALASELKADGPPVRSQVRGRGEGNLFERDRGNSGGKLGVHPPTGDRLEVTELVADVADAVALEDHSRAQLVLRLLELRGA